MYVNIIMRPISIAYPKSQNKIPNEVNRNALIIENKEVEHVGLHPAENNFTQLHTTRI